MNTAFQFALARSSGHSEACHQIKLVEPRVNAFGRFGTTECQIRIDSALASSNFNCFSGGFAFGSHALNKASLFVLKRTQIPSFHALGQVRLSTKIQALVDSHSAKTDPFE